MTGSITSLLRKITPVGGNSRENEVIWKNTQ
jgi:hypothetical protein